MHPRERKETGVVLMRGAAKYQGPPAPIQPEKTARFWLVLAAVGVLVFFGTKVLHCQIIAGGVKDTTVDAPSAVVRQCGPKWMGGCWTYGRPQLGWGETLKSKKFLIPTLTLTAFTGWDYATTAYFSRNGHSFGDPKNGPCMERNQDIGQRPGAGDLAKDFATTHLPVIVLGYFLTKTKLPHWFYDGAATYGSVIHARGAIGWYRECW